MGHELVPGGRSRSSPGENLFGVEIGETKFVGALGFVEGRSGPSSMVHNREAELEFVEFIGFVEFDGFIGSKAVRGSQLSDGCESLSYRSDDRATRLLPSAQSVSRSTAIGWRKPAR